MLPLSLPLLQLLFLLPLLPSLLLHLRLRLLPPPQLLVNQHSLRLLLPLLAPEALLPQSRLIQRPLLLADDQASRICDAFVEEVALLLVEEGLLGFCETVEGVGCGRVGGFVGMDEEGFGAVAFLDVGFGASGLEVEDGVGVETEGFEDAVNFGVLD